MNKNKKMTSFGQPTRLVSCQTGLLSPYECFCLLVHIHVVHKPSDGHHGEIGTCWDKTDNTTVQVSMPCHVIKHAEAMAGMQWHRQHAISMQPACLDIAVCLAQLDVQMVFCTVQALLHVYKHELQCRDYCSRLTKVPASGSASRSHLLEACIKKGVMSKDRAVTPELQSPQLSATTDAASL